MTETLNADGAVMLLRTFWVSYVVATIAVFVVSSALAWVLVVHVSHLLQVMAKYYEAKTADIWRGQQK